MTKTYKASVMDKNTHRVVRVITLKSSSPLFAMLDALKEIKNEPDVYIGSCEEVK